MTRLDRTSGVSSSLKKDKNNAIHDFNAISFAASSRRRNARIRLYLFTITRFSVSRLSTKHCYTLLQPRFIPVHTRTIFKDRGNYGHWLLLYKRLKVHENDKARRFLGRFLELFSCAQWLAAIKPWKKIKFPKQYKSRLKVKIQCHLGVQVYR